MKWPMPETFHGYARTWDTVPNHGKAVQGQDADRRADIHLRRAMRFETHQEIFAKDNSAVADPVYPSM